MSYAVIVGLEAEARIARRLGVPVAVGGGGPAEAANAAERLIAGGAAALVSFGLAGGLDPLLRAGTLVTPVHVLAEDGRWTADPALSATLGSPASGTLYGDGVILTTAAAKRALHARTGAVAVDLESAAVARTAARHGLPFAVLRAICDPAARNLPHAALMALDAQGRIAPFRVALAALSRPREFPALIALARDAALARRALLDRVQAIRYGPRP